MRNHSYWKIIDEDGHKEVIEKVLECLRDLAELMGPSAIANQMDKIVEVINLLLNKKTECQTKGIGKGAGGEGNDEDEDYDDEEEDEEDEDLDHDEVILGNTTDLINALSVP